MLIPSKILGFNLSQHRHPYFPGIICLLFGSVLSSTIFREEIWTNETHPHKNLFFIIGVIILIMGAYSVFYVWKSRNPDWKESRGPAPFRILLITSFWNIIAFALTADVIRNHDTYSLFELIMNTVLLSVVNIIGLGLLILTILDLIKAYSSSKEMR